MMNVASRASHCPHKALLKITVGAKSVAKKAAQPTTDEYLTFTTRYITAARVKSKRIEISLIETIFEKGSSVEKESR
jgi:hypothetical protein